MISTNKGLTSLDLQGNKISGLDCAEISNALKFNHHLKKLDLSCNLDFTKRRQRQQD
jgi:hypothetical protein